MKYRYTVQQLQKMEQCRYLTDRERRVFNLVCRRGWAMPISSTKWLFAISKRRRTPVSIPRKPKKLSGTGSMSGCWTAPPM